MRPPLSTSATLLCVTALSLSTSLPTIAQQDEPLKEVPIEIIPKAVEEEEVAPAERHEIRLFRPLTVGYKFREETTVAYETGLSTLLDGKEKIQNQEKWTVRLDCRQVVLETTPKGAPKAYRLLFDELVRIDENEEEEVLIEPGTILEVHAKANELTEFTRDGEPVDEDLERVLLDLFGVSFKDEQFTSDDIYGSEKKRAIGERWDIDQNKALQWLNNPAAMLVVGATGETSLIKRHEVAGDDCLQIGYTVCIRRQPMARVFMMQGGGAPQQRSETQTGYAMRIDVPIDKKLMERNYHSVRWTRQTSRDDPQKTVSAYVKSTYNTFLTPLPEDTEI